MILNRIAAGLAGAFLALVPLVGANAQTLNFSWPSNVGPLNPHGYSPNQMFAQSMVYEGLVKYAADGTILPWLAESWTSSEDGKTFTFTLRKGVTFSNGEAFDAAAVAANFKTVLANRASHDWLDLINQLESVEAVDPMTVKFTLKQAYYPLLQELALIRPVRFAAPSQFPASGNTEDGLTSPIGTGPWVLKETVLGEYDTFVRNETYWGEKPAYKSIVVKVISDNNTRAVAFETGDIDLIYGAEGPISPDTFARLGAAGYETMLSEPLATRAIAMNTANGPTAELNVRLAINHAVDKATMIAAIYQGTAKPADTLFATNVPYADVGLVPYAHDPALAARLLDEAGWLMPEGGTVREKDGAPLAVDLNYIGTDAVMKSLSEVIQADLGKVGIDVRLVGEEENAFYARQNDGTFGLIFGDSWRAPYDPHAFMSSMRVPSHADYQAQLGLANKAEIDADIARALVSIDETERQEIYSKLLNTLHDQAVYLPLSYVTSLLVARPGVTNLGFAATSNEVPFETLQLAAN